MKTSWNKIYLQTFTALITLTIAYYVSYLILQSLECTHIFKYIAVTMCLLIFTSSFSKIFWWIIFPFVIVSALYLPIALTYDPLTNHILILDLLTNHQLAVDTLSEIPYLHFIYTPILIIGILLYKYFTYKFNLNFKTRKLLVLTCIFVICATVLTFIFPKQIKTSITNDIQEIFTQFENQQTLVAAHRVNIKNKLLELQDMSINNIEIDVFVEDNQLWIGHEKKTASGLTLEEYLQQVIEINPNFTFMWLDLKDLTVENENLIFNQLQQLDNTFKLKDRVFIESRYIDALERFNQSGWHTGYYLIYEVDQQPNEYFKKVIDDLNRLNMSTITFDCRYINFVEDKFKDIQLKNQNKLSTNCWTFKSSDYFPKDFEKLKNIDRLLISVKTKNHL